jgi:PTS system glucitol/sorbitol-specific IIA component
MGEPYYESTILRVGAETDELFEGGVVILFGEPVPDALESVSVIHRAAAAPTAEMRAGDLLQLGGSTIELRAVGERANENLRTLGHIVVYVTRPDGGGLPPGAVHADGKLDVPAAGSKLLLARP